MEITNETFTIEQTVIIPANHRLTIDVPHEVPTGPVVITFKPVVVASTVEALASADNILEKHLFAFKELAK